MNKIVFNEHGAICGIYKNSQIIDDENLCIIVNDAQYEKICELNRMKEVQYLFNSKKDISDENEDIINTIFKDCIRELSEEAIEYIANKNTIKSKEKSQMSLNANILKDNALLQIQNNEQKLVNAKLMLEIAKLK